MTTPDARDDGIRLDLGAIPAYERSLDCVHCGLCLESCPTYRVTGLEPMSPRGRIQLMRGFAEGRTALTGAAGEHLDACLGCRACESACPAGVRYHEMLEVVGEARRARANGRRGRRVRDLALDLVPRRGARRLAAVGLAAFVRSGLRDRLVGSRLLERLSPTIATMARLPPAMTGARRRETARETERRAIGPRRGRVLLLAGCVADDLFPDVRDDAVELLALHGWDVLVDPAESCCGALDLHAGRTERALALVRRTLERLDALGLDRPGAVDHVVSTAAGCGAMLRDLSRHFAGYPALEDLAGRVERRVLDVTELLARSTPAHPPRRIERRVAYDPPCHLLHAQRVLAEPRALLARIPGLELVPLRNAELCCGSAGIYNLVHPAMADAVLADKLDAIDESGAEVVVTGNPGCLMQIAAGLRGRRRPVEVLHPVTLLAGAYLRPPP